MMDRAVASGALKAVALVTAVLFTSTCTTNMDLRYSERRSPRLPAGAKKIEHLIFIMQENRSFDHYFGTFPGADGIPMKGGEPSVCIPNPKVPSGCTVPFHDPDDQNQGGPHILANARRDIHGGAMDGFIRQWLNARIYCHAYPTAQVCVEHEQQPDVVGYHDAREIPNYWAYAKRFVLQDRLFEPNLGWSEPAHLYVVSGWSARCVPPESPANCESSVEFVDVDTGRFPRSAESYQWTDITYLLHKWGVSWRYYVGPGTVNDCGQKCSWTRGTPEIWNPLPDFATVNDNEQVDNIQEVSAFFDAAKNGSLPAVSWILPDWKHSEHPPWPISDGQAWVTRLVNAVGQGPEWESSAIFITWDDWGGYYDHVQPPKVDGLGYGLRVPGMMISPFARRGFIDHQTLSFDAYLKLIEDLFLDGQRLDPFTDGRPDPRPTVREEVPELGDLLREFDFSQHPRPPPLLPPYPGGRQRSRTVA
jgi:phospholipase C